MTFWERVIFNPSSFFEGRKWWQNVLLAVPLIVLAIVGTVIWFFGGSKKSPDYANQAKNDPLDTVNASYEDSIHDIEARRKELKAKAAQKERELIDSMTNLEKIKGDVSDDSHEELTQKLYGKNPD
jgi:flagellar basal body-associated protein FliL